VSDRLRRVPAPVLAFCIALLVYGAALAVVRPATTGDEPHYALEALSLARDGDRDLRNNYLDRSEVAAVTNLPALDVHAADWGDGRLISAHGPGLPFLLAPVAAVTDDVVWMRLVLVLVSSLAAALLLRLVRRLDRGWRGWAAWALVAFSLPLFAYSSQLYPEMVAALCVIAALDVLAAGPARLRPWVLAGAATAVLPWLHVRYLALLAGLVLVFAIVAWTRRRAPGQWRALIGFAAPVLVSLVLVGVAFDGWYGSPVPTVVFGIEDAHATVNGSVAAPEPAGDADTSASATGSAADDGTPAPAAASQTVVEDPWDRIVYLLNTPSPNTVYTSVVANVLSPGGGWLPFAPVHLLALAGLASVAVLRWRWLAVGVLAVSGYLVVLFGTGIESQYALPARYLIAIMPLVAVPLALALRPRLGVAAAVVLGAISLLVSFVGMTHLATLVTPNASIAASTPVLRSADSLWPTTPPVGDAPVSHTPRLSDGRPGVQRSATVTLEPGAYNVAFALAPAQADARAGAAKLEIVSDGGGVVASQTVSGADIGAERVLGIPLQVSGTSVVRFRVASTPPGAARATLVQVAGTRTASSDPPAFYGWAKAVGWGAVILALAAGLVYALVSSSRRLRQIA
jgi:hypothetical protein